MTLETVLPTKLWPNNWWICVWNVWAVAQINVLYDNLVDLLIVWRSWQMCHRSPKRKQQIRKSFHYFIVCTCYYAIFSVSVN